MLRWLSFDSANRVYVGNLSWGVDNLSLETLFSEQRKVLDARVVYDRETGRSRGFVFVTLSSAAEVNSAISSLDGSDQGGRNIRVSAAEARPPKRELCPIVLSRRECVGTQSMKHYIVGTICP